MTPREYLSAAEVAPILGVSHRRVNQMARQYSDFPAPAVTDGGGRVRLWRRADIERWHERVGSTLKPGRRWPEHDRRRSTREAAC